MALDEPRDGDQHIDHDGIQFLLGQELGRWLGQGRAVVIRYDEELDIFLVRLSAPARL